MGDFRSQHWSMTLVAVGALSALLVVHVRDRDLIGIVTVAGAVLLMLATPGTALRRRAHFIFGGLILLGLIGAIPNVASHGRGSLIGFSVMVGILVTVTALGLPRYIRMERERAAEAAAKADSSHDADAVR